MTCQIIYIPILALCLISFWTVTSPAKSPSYAPHRTPCPTGTFVRLATSLSPNESDYVSSRRSNTTSLRSESLLKFIDSARLGISREKLESYVTNTTTALAFSGGGYRAMLNAAGIFNALDSRTSESNFAGLLQGMDYLAGLSGGNWMVGSSSVNDFATVPSLRADTWQLHRDLVTPGSVGDTLAYLGSIRSQVVQKDDAGFNTTITDYWGLALGRQLVCRHKGGVSTTWSGIRDVESFRNATMPFPIVVSDGRRVGEVLAESNATVYEFNPYEFGTWDRGLRLFCPVEYLGTAMDGGKPKNQTCVSGFDYAGFVMGTSSSLFNNIVAAIGGNVSGVEGAALRDIVAPILEGLTRENDDIAEVRTQGCELRKHSQILKSKKKNSTPIRFKAMILKTTPWPITQRWSWSTGARTAKTFPSGHFSNQSDRSMWFWP